MTPKYDVVARFQGGPNAGHTLEFEGKKFKDYEHPELNYESEIINWGSRTIEY